MSRAHQLLEQVNAECSRRSRPPTSTYRLQLHRDFTFRDAEALLPYLGNLGVDTCYASPFLKAVPGSMHGYDITDHSSINPEVGSVDDFHSWTDALRDRGLGLLIDVVPNHMGIVGNQNPWWNSVLEHGRASPFASAFDILWHGSPRRELYGRVLLPVLGESYGRVLEAGELTVHQHEGAVAVHYYDDRFPLDPRSYDHILAPVVERLTAELGNDNTDLQEARSILTAVLNLPTADETDPTRVDIRQYESEVVKRRIATLSCTSEHFAHALEDSLARLNGTAGQPSSFDALDRLLEAQAYRLSYWRVAHDEINYRRFFDINSLVAICIEREDVFNASHNLILDWLADGRAGGARIDHPDGLLDPATYFRRLQDGYRLRLARRLHERNADGVAWTRVEAAVTRAIQSDDSASPLYVVAEKILAWDEALPATWRVQGTTGYDAIARLNSLFVDGAAERAFTEWYEAWTDDDTPLDERVRFNKHLILESSLPSELHMLATLLDRVAQTRRVSRDFTLNALRRALAEVISVFPVYRAYITPEGPSEADRATVNHAIRAVLRHPGLVTSRDILTFLRNVLLTPPGTDAPEEHATFVGRFQQVTSAVMAKGLEDTTFYADARLLSLNEVGGDPRRFGADPQEVHAWCRGRAEHSPSELTPLSTHDTKRGEDVRARINVLSEMPRRWFEAAARWSRMNARHHGTAGDLDVPGREEELLLYQTLLGAWPFGTPDEAEWRTFVDRIRDYMTKSIHEAKVHSSWLNPDADYDAAIATFVDRILDREANAEFLAEIQSLVDDVARAGMMNSLAQTALRLTIPGVPDTYQGTELWDLNLVDPDNRRPVDYERRARYLDELRSRWDRGDAGRRTLIEDLLAHPEDGRIKLFLTWRLLQARRRHPALFSSGDYTPLEVMGTSSPHIYAFQRSSEDGDFIVAVPRLILKLTEAGWPLGDTWADTELPIPAGTWTDAITGQAVESNGMLRLATLFSQFPVAALLRVRQPST